MKKFAMFGILLLSACSNESGQRSPDTALALLDASNLAPISQRQHMCGHEDAPALDLRSGPYSLSQLQETGLKFAVVGEKDLAHAPFGRANREWRALVSLFKSGDKIYYYTTSAGNLPPYSGGYALSRNDCIVSAFGVWKS